MGIQSPIKEISNVHFEKVKKSKVYKCAKVAFVWNDSNRGGPVVLGVTENGRMITSEKNEQDFYVLAGSEYTQREKSFVKALRLLGVITREQEIQHGEWREDRASRLTKKYAAEGLERSLKSTGLKPTKAQERYIAKWSGNGWVTA